MVFAVSLSSRFWRALLLLLGGWLVLEFALMQLIAARIGWGATLAFLSVKGGVGLLLVGLLTVRGLKSLGRGGITRAGGSLGFGIASGVLITLPGIFPSLVGIALFAPSLRAAILRRFTAQEGNAPRPPREVDLGAGEWRELRTRRLVKRTRTRAKPVDANALERKPPSV